MSDMSEIKIGDYLTVYNSDDGTAFPYEVVAVYSSNHISVRQMKVIKSRKKVKADKLCFDIPINTYLSDTSLPSKDYIKRKNVWYEKVGITKEMLDRSDTLLWLYYVKDAFDIDISKVIRDGGGNIYIPLLLKFDTKYYQPFCD